MNDPVVRFTELWVKFCEGKAWLSRGYAARGWTESNRTKDPGFERDVKDFEDRVERPMDAAWAELDVFQRVAAEIQCARRRRPIPAALEMAVA